MEYNLTTTAIIQILISIVLGIIILYISYKLTKRSFKKYIDKNNELDIQKDNLAFAVFLSAILFSVGYLFSGIIEPSISTLNILADKTESQSELMTEFSRYFFKYILAAGVTVFLTIYISIRFYDYLTKKIKEYEEISNNNVGVALVTGVMIIVISLFVKDGLTLLIESMIPFEQGLIY